MEIAARSKNPPLTLAERWQRDLNVKPRPTEASALLTQCLALVRPVGFSDENANAWLTTAVGDVLEIPADILRDACRHARKTADHHSKVLPAIFAYADPEIKARRSHIIAVVPDKPALPAPDQWMPADGELDRIKQEMADNFPSNR
jgi:hypothetical protein